MKKEFLDLGKQPIANNFLKETEISTEFFYNLKVVFDEDTMLVSLKNFVRPELMFNDDYVYGTSLSTPMVTHFKTTSDELKSYRNQIGYKTDNVLEIGSNDGTFIKNFNNETSVCVEPCGNFSLKTAHMGYQSYTSFWNCEISNKIKINHGKMDLIYAANCICHIHDLDDTFKAIKNLLSDTGMFVFEDPSLLCMLERGSYDQIYDEHAHIFSVTSLRRILENNGLTLFKVENLSVHGGSNRIYATHSDVLSNMNIDQSVFDNVSDELDFKIDKFVTYENFASRVKKSKKELIELLTKLSNDGKKVISIGATSKSTTVFNYCDIDSSLIECITDTTPDKQDLLSPGVHIPVVSRESVDLNDYDYVFLGAWNFKVVIFNNEKEFVDNGGKFITHVPVVEII
jgi:methylation protein EvaC|tara:strand:+ start:778 stop:1977 length:1200 start_codon:yes stop_codon:yes gene_type:complete